MAESRVAGDTIQPGRQAPGLAQVADALDSQPGVLSQRRQRAVPGTGEEVIQDRGATLPRARGGLH